MKAAAKKNIGMAFVAAAVLALALMAFRIISWVHFWMIIAVCAFVAYCILPRLRADQ